MRGIYVHQGLFIAIEGSDGSGKGTQFKLLVERLKAAGYEVATYDFPQYDRESSYFVKEYLNGTYGTAEAVGPYTPSVFYALDRYSVAAQIAADLAAGKVVVSNRFTGSSMAHQGTKFSTSEERRAFFDWIEQLEFNMLGIPRPDINIVLLVPADVAQKLVDQKEKRSYTDNKRDLHEADLGHLERAVETFRQLTDTYETFTAINCSKDSELLSIPTINNQIWERIEPMFGRLRKKNNAKAEKTHEIASTSQPPKHSAAQNKATTPVSLNSELAKAFKKHLALLEDTQKKLNGKLKDTANDTIALIQPVTDLEPVKLDSQLVEVIKSKNLQPIKGDGDTVVTLLDHWPKNETEIIPHALYPHSTLTIAELSHELAKWNYAEKEALLKLCLENADLSQITYHLELVTSYALYAQLADVGVRQRQALTPFYGFDDTKALEDPAVESLVSECFASSMQLYQALSTAGYTSQAELACLTGHKLKWQLTLGLNDLQTLYKSQTVSGAEATSLLHSLVLALAEAHPVVSSSL